MFSNFILWSDAFKEQMLKFCSQDFIDRNIHSFETITLPRLYQRVNFIEVTAFLNTEEQVLNKVRFCLVWLQAITAETDSPQVSIVMFHGIGYTSMYFTDFLCKLTEWEIITKEEHMQLVNEWIDMTNGQPYYE